MKKTLIGIMSFAPIVLFVVSIIMMVVGIVMSETSSEDAGLALAMISCVLMFVCVAVVWIDIIWFIIIVCRKKHWPTDKKVVWGLLVYLLNIFVFPFFWWNAIVKDNP